VHFFVTLLVCGGWPHVNRIDATHTHSHLLAMELSLCVGPCYCDRDDTHRTHALTNPSAVFCLVVMHAREQHADDNSLLHPPPPPLARTQGDCRTEATRGRWCRRDSACSGRDEQWCNRCCKQRR
jgi:hypothetical protein